ncbi:hypothetical protein V6N12_024941 [Hibiscus sabdariffa]|uniref:RNase H type-1 domain-containing protein n=1 Tax=Hibiscus sabdariffa TaxID=183260 RepID=A0ABR2A4N9_9ROSI
MVRSTYLLRPTTVSVMADSFWGEYMVSRDCNTLEFFCGVESIPIMNKSLRLVSEFRTTASSRLLVDTKQQQHRCSLVQWRLPARDWLKVNIDASRCSTSGYATYGGVVRDSGGT